MSRPDAVVVGCGVSGLTTGIALQERGATVRIVAEEPPERTTSAVAAALWYPYLAFPRERVVGWGRETFEELVRLVDEPDAGVRMADGVELWRREAPEPWWREGVPNVRRELPGSLPERYRDGIAFTAPVADMSIYLGYLRARFEAAGGVTETCTVRDLRELRDAAGVVVNCAGLGSTRLAADDSLVPVRGQSIRVRNPGLERFLLDDEEPAEMAYVIPRFDDCVLGGTADEGDWNLEPKPDVGEAIFRRCLALEPRLANAEVLEHRVGLRPRRPAIRVEFEHRDAVQVVHNYGHGGAGVTLSWGCAREAADLALRAS